ncbi:MAG: hypothetical protein JO015_15620 [Verrucomicrobia bacterium]|nr:hypothetical protein [Verrucomicrobiota bacterium]
MYPAHDVQYALENTRVVVSPDRRIDTFGTTNFRFYLVSELMDSVGEVRVRDGRISAERPRILTPEHASRLLLDGFGEDAQQFARLLQSRHAALLKYGFEIRKSDLSDVLVHDSLESVLERVDRQIPQAERSGSAVIQGVEEGWEICLLKFTFDLIQLSAGTNIFDLKRRGLL